MFTGTNRLLRILRFQEVGWWPDYLLAIGGVWLGFRAGKTWGWAAVVLVTLLLLGVRGILYRQFGRRHREKVGAGAKNG